MHRMQLLHEGSLQIINGDDVRHRRASRDDVHLRHNIETQNRQVQGSNNMDKVVDNNNVRVGIHGPIGDPNSIEPLHWHYC